MRVLDVGTGSGSNVARRRRRRPRPHRRTGQELLRVCKPGGSVGFTTWRTRGLSGQLFRVVGAHAPPPPEGIGVPPRWGDREHVRAMLAPAEPEFAEDEVV
jgi:hypothetical protein